MEPIDRKTATFFLLETSNKFLSFNLAVSAVLRKDELKEQIKHKNLAYEKAHRNLSVFTYILLEFYIYAQDADLSVRTAPGRGGGLK